MVSCEHGGDAIPKEWQGLFGNEHDTIIRSQHCEFGAQWLFDSIAPRVADYSDSSKVSRLLIDLDGSISNGTALTEYSQSLPAQKAGQIIRDYYLPYWMGFEDTAEQWTRQGKRILAIGIHTFEPVVGNVPVGTDICLTFDHSNNEERSFALRLKRAFDKYAPWLRVRFNAPFKVKHDGFIQHLRDIYQHNILAIEIFTGQNVIFPRGVQTIADVIADVTPKWVADTQQ